MKIKNINAVFFFPGELNLTISQTRKLEEKSRNGFFLLIEPNYFRAGTCLRLLFFLFLYGILYGDCRLGFNKTLPVISNKEHVRFSLVPY